MISGNPVCFTMLLKFVFKIVNERSMHLWSLNSFRLSPWSRLPRYLCIYQGDELNHLLAQNLKERIVAWFFLCMCVYVCVHVCVCPCVYMPNFVVLFVLLLAGWTYLEGISWSCQFAWGKTIKIKWPSFWKLVKHLIL